MARDVHQILEDHIGEKYARRLHGGETAAPPASELLSSLATADLAPVSDFCAAAPGAAAGRGIAVVESAARLPSAAISSSADWKRAEGDFSSRRVTI